MNQTASQDVLYEEHGAVAVLTLNRPAALNSFTRRMHRDLWAALDKVEANKAIRALVLTGAGRGFCAGADLSEFDFSEGPNLEKRADPGPVIDQAFNPTTRRLLQVRVPTVCAVNGVAGRGRVGGHGLRHRHCGAHGQLHPGLQQDRPGARQRRHLVFAAARGPGARHGAVPDGR